MTPRFHTPRRLPWTLMEGGRFSGGILIVINADRCVFYNDAVAIAIAFHLNGN